MARENTTTTEDHQAAAAGAEKKREASLQVVVIREETEKMLEDHVPDPDLEIEATTAPSHVALTAQERVTPEVLSVMRRIRTAADVRADLALLSAQGQLLRATTQ